MRSSTLAKSSTSVTVKATRLAGPKHAGGRPKGIPNTKTKSLVFSLALGSQNLRRNKNGMAKSARSFSSPVWREEVAVKKFVRAFSVKATLGFKGIILLSNPHFGNNTNTYTDMFTK